jgi:hypothetical protein
MKASVWSAYLKLFYKKYCKYMLKIMLCVFNLKLYILVLNYESMCSIYWYGFGNIL